MLDCKHLDLALVCQVLMTFFEICQRKSGENLGNSVLYRYLDLGYPCFYLNLNGLTCQNYVEITMSMMECLEFYLENMFLDLELKRFLQGLFF